MTVFVTVLALAVAPEPTPLWLMDIAQWRRTPPATQIVLAQDYMRAFCGRPTMRPQQLVDCLAQRARSAQGGTDVFSYAASCVRDLN